MIVGEGITLPPVKILVWCSDHSPVYKGECLIPQTLLYTHCVREANSLPYES